MQYMNNQQKSTHKTIMKRNRCNLCTSETLQPLLTCTAQPLANRFLQTPTQKEYTHTKNLTLCRDCGLVQLADPVPAKELKPRVDWIRYNEPETHLNNLATTLTELPGITPQSIIGATSYKDTTLLQRLIAKGFTAHWQIIPETDLHIQDTFAGIETIQAQIPQTIDEPPLNNLPKADILLVRHILEHTHDIRSFTKAVKKLLNKNGYIIFEVPCCDTQIEKFDYAKIWEEHIAYFTPATFHSFFSLSGLSLLHFKRYHYQLEDVLVGIATINQHPESANTVSPVDCDSIPTLSEEISHAEQYGATFHSHATRLKTYLSKISQHHGKIAVFGAGHMAATFINMFNLHEFISLVVDDNPDKAGLFMPGSRVPIKPAEVISETGISIFLLTVNPEIEKKIIPKLQKLTNNKGIYYSIFPDSQLALDLNSHLKTS